MPRSATPRSHSAWCSRCSPSPPWRTSCSPGCGAAAGTWRCSRPSGSPGGRCCGAVAWEATALAAAALLIGIPVGVVAGRWAWALFADAAGVASQATVQVPLVLLAIPVTIALANVLAAWPGWAAARLRPALVLRTE